MAELEAIYMAIAVMIIGVVFLIIDYEDKKKRKNNYKNRIKIEH